MEKDKPENLGYNFSGIYTMNIDWCLDTEVIFDMPIKKKALVVPNRNFKVIL